MVAGKQLEAKKDIQTLIFKSMAVLFLFVIVSFLLVWFLSQRIKKNIGMFNEFFKLSANKAIPIDQETVAFSEFQSLAVSANKMSKERQKSEKALRESEKKYRYLFKHAPAGIYEIDFIKGRFVTVNDGMCKFSGYSEIQFLSMDPKKLFSKDTLLNLDRRFKMLFKGGALEETIEADLIKKDGETVCIIMASYYIFDGDKLKGARVVAHDITDLKQVEKEKLQAEKIAGEQKKLAMVGQIAGKMAHDFNNILGIIMGNTELLLVRSKEAEAKNKLALILNQTLRGRNLTKNLVAFAKDQEPKQNFFKINEKVDLVLTLMKKDLEAIALIREDKSGVPDVLADPGMISVESEPGEGTKFIISLPVVKKELTREEKKEIQKDVHHFEKYILLVEDETAISEVQYTILTQDPCNNKVDIANNGQAALDLLDRNVYDLGSPQ